MPPPPIGIDIGATTIHVATSFDPHTRPTAISLQDENWHEQLARLVPRGALVTLEPTGWHYSAPVITALLHQDAQVVMVEHRITGLARELRISGAKRDLTDAQTLCYIAATYNTAGFRGVHPVAPEDESRVTELRLLVRAQVRATKETTRTKNRLRQLAHSTWPALAQHLGTYLRAVNSGAITPAELRELVTTLRTRPAGAKWPTAYHHGNARRPLIKLVESLPPWLQSSHVRDTIAREAAMLADAERRSAELERLTVDLIHEPPFEAITEVWETVPASGPVWIAALHAATHGHAAEMTLQQFKASVGSYPQVSQSGETSESIMSRQGFKPAKAALYLWAMSLIDGNNPIAAAFALREAKGRKNNLAAARGKLCAILWALATTGQPYDPQKGKPQ